MVSAPLAASGTVTGLGSEGIFASDTGGGSVVIEVAAVTGATSGLVAGNDNGGNLTVTTTGAANTVVWNPWIAKAAAMLDFGDDEWQGMICVEGANALDNAVVLPPGGTHTLVYRLTVAAL